MTPEPKYVTAFGKLYVGKSEELFAGSLGADLRGKVQLIFTSPPFPLNEKKQYGNLQGEDYINWFSAFAPLFADLLTPDQEFWPDESGAEIDADSVVGLSSEQSTSGVHVGQREGHLFASRHNHTVCRAQESVSGIIAKGVCLHESCLLQIGLEFCR